jgi:uncharacterized sporulation protein YeaH/YhbH (DUF444 family)
MRKVLISLAAAAATIAVAAPASAQVYGNHYGYGYQNAGNLRAEIQQVRYQTSILARQGRLTRGESRDLNRDIANAERAIYNANYRGLSPWEAQNLQQRVARLRYEVARYSDYDRRGGYAYGNGWRH